MLTQSDYSDLGAAYGKMVPFVGAYAAKHEWTKAQTRLAFEVLSGLYDDYSGLDGWARIKWQTGNLVPLQWMLASDDPDTLAVLAVLERFAAWLDQTTYPGRVKLANVFHLAAGTAQSELAEDKAHDFTEQAAGGIEGSLDDARSLGSWTADTVTEATAAASSAAKNPTSRKAIALVAAALVGLVVGKKLGLL